MLFVSWYVNTPLNTASGVWTNLSASGCVPNKEDTCMFMCLLIYVMHIGIIMYMYFK